MKVVMIKIVMVVVLFALNIKVSESTTHDLITEERPSLFLSYLCLQSEHFKDFCLNDMESKSNGPVQNLLRNLKAQRQQKSRQSSNDDFVKLETPTKRRTEKESGFYSNW
ncbi:hypothetical protein SNE40_007373 [Patella caerulea]|uniref:Uncharacterized protein n=1 Tax=Patella caerulea TaxID=87958 RepID=A0AAN8PTL2_PATCE